MARPLTVAERRRHGASAPEPRRCSSADSGRSSYYPTTLRMTGLAKEQQR